MPSADDLPPIQVVQCDAARRTQLLDPRISGEPGDPNALSVFRSEFLPA